LILFWESNWLMTPQLFMENEEIACSLFKLAILNLHILIRLSRMQEQFLAVLRSRSRKEPHLLVGAGAVTRCGSGSGSDGSGSDNGIYHG
jgi:hypothetical protein